MPEMDGLEATAAIRERERSTGQHVPIVAMTAHAMKGDEERCLTAGMDAYVSKPIKPDALFTVLAHFAATPGSSAEPPPRLSELIDWKDALNRVRGDVDLLRELTVIFLDELSKWRASLRDGVTRSDAELIGRTAHTLKGSLGMFAAANAYAAAEHLEGLVRNGMSADAPATLARLERELDALVPALVRFGSGETP